MNYNNEDSYTSPPINTQLISSPNSSEAQSESSDILGADQATISGASYRSTNSYGTNTHITDLLIASNMASVISPTNTTAPNASVLKHLTKLTSRNYVAWKRDLEIHLDACGLGGFVVLNIPEPTVVTDILLWRMHQAQVLLAIWTTITSHKLNAISSAQHPFDALTILS